MGILTTPLEDNNHLKRIYLSIFLLVLTASFARAQQSHIAFSEGTQGQFLVAVDGSFDIGSNAVKTKFFNSFYSGKFIDTDLKDKTYKSLKNNNRIGFDVTYRLQIAQMPDSVKSWGYYASLNNVIHADAGFKGDLFRLAFSGNSDYAGQTMELGKSDFQFLSYRQVKAGFIKGSNKSTWGLGLSFIKGESYLGASLDKGELFTETDGLYLDITSQLTLQRSDTGDVKFSDMVGWGAGLDFLYSAQLNDKSKLNIEVSDLGFISWSDKSVKIENDTTLHFEGIEIDNLIDLGDSLFTGFTTDSLLDTLGAHSSSGAFSTVVPGYIHLNYITQLKDNLALNAGIAQRLKANFFPYIYVGTNVKLGERVTFTNRLSYGGYASLGVGVGMRFDIGKFMRFEVNSNHIEGYLIPGATTAQGVSVNLMGRF